MREEVIVCVCETAPHSVESVAAGDRANAAAVAADVVPAAAQRRAERLRRRAGVGARQPPQRRPGDSDVHAADALRAGRQAPPDAHQQRRDARAARADRAPRRDVVSRARHAEPAGLDARHAVGPGRASGRLRDRARRLAQLAASTPPAASPPAARARSARRLRRRLDRRHAARAASRSSTNTSPYTAPRSAPASSLLLSEDACPVAETARVARWLADQSARPVWAVRQRPRRARRARSRRSRRASRRATTAQADRAARVAGAPARRVRASRRRRQVHPQRAARRSPRSSPTTRVTVRCERCDRRAELPLPARCAGRRRRDAGRWPSDEPALLRLNPIACEAHGMCAELLARADHARRVGLSADRRRAAATRAHRHAKRAAAACPTFALLLERNRE